MEGTNSSRKKFQKLPLGRYVALFFGRILRFSSCLMILQNLALFLQSDCNTEYAEYCKFHYGSLAEQYSVCFVVQSNCENEDKFYSMNKHDVGRRTQCHMSFDDYFQKFFHSVLHLPHCLIILRSLAPMSELDHATDHADYCPFNYGPLYISKGKMHARG